MPADLFFPEHPDNTMTQEEREAYTQQLALVYSICEGCPVRGECLAYGKSSGESGVWGGQYLGAEAGVGGSLNNFVKMRDGVPEPGRNRADLWNALRTAREVKCSGPPTLAEYVKSQATNGTTTREHQAWVRRRASGRPELSPDWNDRPMLNGTALHAEMVYVETGIAALENQWVTVAELVERTGLTIGVVQHVLHHLHRRGQVILQRQPYGTSGVRYVRSYQAVL